MHELRQFLASLNFAPPSLELDGKIHRFGRDGGKDNAWYIGWQNHSVRTGQTYVVAKFGDWRTAEEHFYKPDKVSRIDMKAVKEQIAEAAQKAAEATRLKHEEAAQRALDKWNAAATTGSCAYMERKLIPELYGCRLNGDTLLIPVRDVDGKLWGIESVYPDNKKMFMSGQKVNECFHVIGGEIGDDVYLCEGFATGASIYQATGVPTVVAFYATNLAPVVKVLKMAHPLLHIAVCGDDDRFKGDNVGRAKGVKAAELAMGESIFPVFASDEGQPTDFNDLHAREGLDAVKKQLGAMTEPEKGFVPLGYQESTYFFYDIESRDIVKINGFSPAALFQIADRSYWEERYPGKAGVDWQQANNDLIRMSRAVGPFDPSRVHGTGVWLDEGRIVVNTGAKLLVDGHPCGLAAIKSHHIYIQATSRLSNPWAPLTDAKSLLDACELLCWQDPKSAYLLAGWLAVARIAGALPIRPHVWLTGGSGTGKSTVMERIIAPTLGVTGGHMYLQGSSTEAGIRQSLKSSSIPVIFDEFEATSDSSKVRVAALIELLRSSWSATRGRIFKGSGSGVSVDYPLNFAALVSSIRVNLENDADRSRFSVLELSPHGGDASQWKDLQACLAHIDEAFGERLFARSCRLVNVIMESYKTLQVALSKAVNQRFGQQVGILLAGYWSLRSERAITPEEAANVTGELDVGNEKQEARDTDQVEAFVTFCTTNIAIQLIDERRVLNIEESIIDLILSSNSDKISQLKRWGILVHDDVVLIHTKHQKLIKDVWRGTRWESCYARSLSRLLDAKRSDPTWFDKAAPVNRALSLPKGIFVSMKKRLECKS